MKNKLLTLKVFISLVFGGLILFGLNKTAQASTIPFNIPSQAVEQELPHAFVPSETQSYSDSFASLVGSLISIVMPVAALLLLLYLIWGAIEWITSGGDKGKLEKSRQRITTGVIGIIIVSATVSLFMLMQQILNVCILDFWDNDCSAPPVAPECTPGDSSCSSEIKLMVCNSNGQWQATYCEDGKECVNDHCE